MDTPDLKDSRSKDDAGAMLLALATDAGGAARVEGKRRRSISSRGWR
jgi:hypothetical protein